MGSFTSTHLFKNFSGMTSSLAFFVLCKFGHVLNVLRRNNDEDIILCVRNMVHVYICCDILGNMHSQEKKIVFYKFPPHSVEW